MKKTWFRRLTAVSFAFIAVGTGTGTMLLAQENSVNSGGGGI